MRLTVLGSGTLLPDDDRRSPAHLIETDRARILLDCGAGTVHGLDRHGVDWRRISHLAVSHFHTDHVGDVAPLLWALRHGMRPPRSAPLTVLGPPGIGRFMESLGEAHGAFVLDPGFPVVVVELRRRDQWADPTAQVRLSCAPAFHTEESVCWRVETPEGVVGYTGDTGEDDGVATFLRGAGVLVSECSLPDPPEIETHLTPRGVARLAATARPELLLLTHLYPFLDPEELPDLVRRAGYRGAVRTARDGTRVVLERGEAPRVEPDPGGEAA
ncbi:MAG: ribonuclease Z [Gemmatimonadota bacterium]